MSIETVRDFSGPDGQVSVFRLHNSSGAYAEVMNYGARVTAVVVPDRKGRLENVVLSYPVAEHYLADRYYLGSTVGRFANRISGAGFVIDGSRYELDKNDGQHCNHGGYSGLDSKTFVAAVNEDEVEFSAFSRDGEGGFPGNLRVTVAYSFTERNELVIRYRVASDKKTPVGLTNHCYFNLKGCGNVLGHQLRIDSGRFVETGEGYIPTGRILPVGNTPYDFRTLSVIGEMIKNKNESGAGGCNTFYPCASGEVSARLCEPVSGRRLDVTSSMLGIFLYTGDFLGEPFTPYAGLCLEAQHYPDWINRKEFPGHILKPGEVMSETIKYSFTVIPE